uniref:Uncharacterized protein n=1 Tax=Palpitomonas bilix TaxID=652834 RepID=A0A7S3DFB8_9EUKA|mmetsp:Transcript_3495/g.6856  ORF Transcript_3495/g.6856 Transcript_3495/m.6856 type:complete len:170 (+) Transcript_3495:142-651(+)|eukprot:CAMPEP_0113896884 /NCGR_PEP_ID=MMETSP0780_2-20120614/18318_1 /TAXON_ID=652834 /ORGANISM="Palpitomonas bilix" /LENGTH=169 /DNA_ID=CAMNT_0000888179 /DNA_START=149 /DNA_END=658 /DNA_ORIENTATION=+ /assembly_acc=CAM_ASM_000599
MSGKKETDGKAGRGLAYLDATRKYRNAGHRKHGTEGKEGSHKLSHELAAEIISMSAGRGGRGTGPGTDCYSISTAINTDGNIRRKNQDTNRKLDRRRDGRIASAIASHSSLTEKTTTGRAVQAYKGSLCAQRELDGNALDSVVQKLGDLTFNDGKRGRPVKISTLASRM